VLKIIGGIFFMATKPLFHKSSKEMIHGPEEGDDKTLRRIELHHSGLLWKK